MNPNTGEITMDMNPSNPININLYVTLSIFYIDGIFAESKDSLDFFVTTKVCEFIKFSQDTSSTKTLQIGKD